MKRYLVRVTENRFLWGNIQLLTLHAPELARAIRPGQFALARDPNTFDPYLRRELDLYATHDEFIQLTANAKYPLEHTIAGDTLDVLAPLGRAIEFETSARHILLVGERECIAPLVPVAHEAITLGHEVVLALQGHSDLAEGIFPSNLLSPEIEYRTDEALDSELIRWADALIASGLSELYRNIADALSATRYRIEPGFARVLVDMPMPCGMGVCYACAVETSRGVQLACVDGPAMDLVELFSRRT
jgi:dihydroorotate dehydrogenase electron transfer subunit